MFFLVDIYLSGNRIGAMNTQTTLDLVTKLPLSEVPRKKHRGVLCLDQKALQVDGIFKLGDPHPSYEGIFFYSLLKNGQNWKTQGWLDNKRKKDNEHKKARRKNDPEWAKAQDAKENQAKRDKMGEEAYLAYMRKHGKAAYKRNPEAFALKASRYEKRIRHMYKNLSPFLKKKVDEIYSLRQQLNEAAVGAGMFGKGFNGNKRYAFAVDHIMPVTHDELCGLHIPCNLKLIEADANSSKSNKVLPSEC